MEVECLSHMHFLTFSQLQGQPDLVHRCRTDTAVVHVVSTPRGGMRLNPANDNVCATSLRNIIQKPERMVFVPSFVGLHSVFLKVA